MGGRSSDTAFYQAQGGDEGPFGRACDRRVRTIAPAKREIGLGGAIVGQSRRHRRPNTERPRVAMPVDTARVFLARFVQRTQDVLEIEQTPSRFFAWIKHGVANACLDAVPQKLNDLLSRRLVRPPFVSETGRLSIPLSSFWRKEQRQGPLALSKAPHSALKLPFGNPGKDKRVDFVARLAHDSSPRRAGAVLGLRWYLRSIGIVSDVSRSLSHRL